MKHATSRAIVFIMVIFALIVVINDIKSQRLEELQSQQVEIKKLEKPGLAISELEED